MPDRISYGCISFTFENAKWTEILNKKHTYHAIMIDEQLSTCEVLKRHCGAR